MIINGIFRLCFPSQRSHLSGVALSIVHSLCTWSLADLPDSEDDEK